MPQICGLTSIAAATTTNVLSGKLFERLGARPAQVKVYAVNTTAVLGELLATMYVGSEVLCQDVPLTLDTGGLKVPDHQIANGVGLPGDQLKLDVQNTNAGAARSVQFIVDIAPK